MFVRTVNVNQNFPNFFLLIDLVQNLLYFGSSLQLQLKHSQSSKKIRLKVAMFSD